MTEYEANLVFGKLQKYDTVLIIKKNSKIIAYNLIAYKKNIRKILVSRPKNDTIALNISSINLESNPNDKIPKLKIKYLDQNELPNKKLKSLNNSLFLNNKILSAPDNISQLKNYCEVKKECQFLSIIEINGYLRRIMNILNIDVDIKIFYDIISMYYLSDLRQKDIDLMSFSYYYKPINISKILSILLAKDFKNCPSPTLLDHLLELYSDLYSSIKFEIYRYILITTQCYDLQTMANLKFVIKYLISIGYRIKDENLLLDDQNYNFKELIIYYQNNKRKSDKTDVNFK